MAMIKQLKQGEEVIYPLTSTKAIVDEQGKRVSIPTKTSELINDSGFVNSQTIKSVVAITQADYDALETKDETTLYLITEQYEDR